MPMITMLPAGRRTRKIDSVAKDGPSVTNPDVPGKLRRRLPGVICWPDERCGRHDESGWSAQPSHMQKWASRSQYAVGRDPVAMDRCRADVWWQPRPQPVAETSQLRCWSLFGYTSDLQPDAPESKRSPGALAAIALLASFAGLVMLVWPYFA